MAWDYSQPVPPCFVCGSNESAWRRVEVEGEAPDYFTTCNDHKPAGATDEAPDGICRECGHPPWAL